MKPPYLFRIKLYLIFNTIFEQTHNICNKRKNMTNDFSWLRDVILPFLISGGILAAFVKFFLEKKIIEIQDKLKKEEKRNDFFNNKKIKMIELLKDFNTKFELFCGNFECELNDPRYDCDEDYAPDFVQKIKQHKDDFRKLKTKYFCCIHDYKKIMGAFEGIVGEFNALETELASMPDYDGTSDIDVYMEDVDGLYAKHAKPLIDFMEQIKDESQHQIEILSGSIYQ